ncbi:MAG TPA: class I SAM-dependent methyltransferase [Candidatus Sabulitectum sp.]|nr:class I SAM-dependent methyltransferase [Candidatus Sabulitectum sp.]HPJ28273.1 class I SAM-dependent methyltransferase [Candidatus Sabulitectum sp.]HPR22381.1 class I SAM-dependent methyltransferase [Candidatus Sabulitectum sp.]
MNPWTDPRRVREYSMGRKDSPADALVLEMIERLKPGTVMEIGTGPGKVFKAAGSQKGWYPTDLSPVFLEGLDSRLGVCCHAASLPFPERSFHCVLAMAVLHHLRCDDLQEALREVYRILVPGGTFILLEDWCFARGATPFEEEARKTRFRHGTRENHLAEGTWVLELELAGLRVTSRTWTTRPFSTGDPRLLQWSEDERVVRMLCFQALKP